MNFSTKSILSILLIMLIASAPLFATAQQNRPQTRNVFCHDPAHDTVLEIAAELCYGRIISPQEATEINNRRAEHVRRALQNDGNKSSDRRVAAIGTGFFISNEGAILTNRHVVDNCSAIGIATTTGNHSIAKVKRIDQDVDLALLMTPITPPQVASLSPANPNMNERLSIIGFPAYGLAPLTPAMIEGQLLNMVSSPETKGRLAIRADVRHGNSGGPVLDEHGNVIGIIYAKLNTPKIFAETKQKFPDIGVAIDRPTLKAFLDRERIQYAVGQPTPSVPQPGDTMLDYARPFVVRVQCWK